MSYVEAILNVVNGVILLQFLRQLRALRERVAVPVWPYRSCLSVSTNVAIQDTGKCQCNR